MVNILQVLNSTGNFSSSVLGRNLALLFFLPAVYSNYYYSHNEIASPKLYPLWFAYVFQFVVKNVLI